MLHKIEIDGFRSLLQFNISLRPGLNVIVGANGTGKSNFISFLDFLGTLIGNDLNAAIALAQGAGSMFSKERFIARKPAELTFKLDGQLHGVTEEELPLFASEPDKYRRLAGNYSYACTISYDPTVPSVFVSAETLTVRSNDVHDLTVSRSTVRTEDGFDTRVDVFPIDHRLNRTVFRYLRRNEAKVDIGKYLAMRVTPERTILPYIGHESPAFAYIVNDLTRYRSVNIDPSVARKPTPVGSYTTLGANGEGLAGALYQLKHGSYFPGRTINRYSPPKKLDTTAFGSILSWCREVNPDIEDVLVDLDVMEAQLRPRMRFRRGFGCEEFTFSRISDGTVKWLALATVLFAEPGLSIIEEPENFLHPFMQESFVALCRQALQNDPRRTLIISTHSPTLLDCCAPDELTLFQLTEGKTRAAKIANQAELERKLQEARFGLGHYYRIGAIYGEDSSNS